MRPLILLGLACVATVVLYWLGLYGPFLLDDHVVLSPVEAWHAGQQGWLATLLPNPASVINSRPVAMASFMLTTSLGGVGPFSYKLGNVVVHLLCGILGWWLLRRVLRLDPRLAAHADVLALAATALWLLHPLHVSTVLYAVQRMAQLAAFFSLAAVAIYLVARQQLAAGRVRTASLHLFLTFPLLLALGILSKQNAAIAGFLCLVLELAYFQRPARDPRLVWGFFGLFVALPVMAVLGLLAFAPDRLLAGYAEWNFTLWQRLMTQARAMIDYIGMWFLPRGPQMGLYTDGYPVSSGLLSPPTTLLAIVALVTLSLFAIAIRKRAPAVFAGWFFFLVAHSVESSFLPLEMYYEHRNYLPAFGLLLMAFGLLGLIPDTTWSRMANPRRLGIVAVSALTLTLAFATFGRVLVWQQGETIVAQGLYHHPESLRARLDAATISFWNKDYASAVEVTRPLLTSAEPEERAIGNLQMVVIGCLDGKGADPKHLEAATEGHRSRVTIAELQMARLLVNVTQTHTCGAVTPGMIGSTLAALVDSADGQPETAPAKFSTRTIAARMHARGGEWKEAEHHAEIVWNATRYLPLAALLARIYIDNGKFEQAEELLGELKRRARPFDTPAQDEISRVQAMLDDRRSKAGR
ncbi:hypothetical protein [Luteimonas sp. MC1572]|uniref:hypothetical protein n=1 Tax=Luteimonas sp. MC1572 TaxID=2799325 RepID=UPI0018F0AD13|nr:hypothetical protein [Luteimonas sp. MC1572]MBJ6981374.1 hypothetical protein [Luteimonas sp. MC1572]QQO02687.1 hypothetical protein JGR64_10975 [Luteimonas sp. MC1572]